MGVNKYKAHVWVIPEDDANRELANGFLLHHDLQANCIDIRPPSGGWPKVLDDFLTHHVEDLRKFQLRHLVLLIDFDDQFDTRITFFRGKFPEDVANRVYVLGTRGEPEPLRVACGKSLEQIGQRLASDCANADGDDPTLWEHELLNHNANELARLHASVKPFLFR